MPDLLGAEGAEIRYAINGLLSLTPDGAPLLGETPEVTGLWSAAAVWVKEGPGVGRAVAEWMTDGLPEIDLANSDIARFYPHQRTRQHIQPAPARRSTRRTASSTPASSTRATATNGSRRCMPTTAARRVLLRGGRLGAPVLVRVQRQPARRVRRPGDAARARVGLPVVVANHQRRAPAPCATGRASSTCRRSPSSTWSDRGAGRRTVHRRRAVRRSDRPGDLHTGARRPRRLPLRPHRDAARARPVPRRHRWRPRHGRPEVVRRPDAEGRYRVGRRPHLRLHDHRPVGAAGARHPRRADPRRHQPRRASASAPAGTSRSTR